MLGPRAVAGLADTFGLDRRAMAARQPRHRAVFSRTRRMLLPVGQAGWKKWNTRPSAAPEERSSPDASTRMMTASRQRFGLASPCSDPRTAVRACRARPLAVDPWRAPTDQPVEPNLEDLVRQSRGAMSERDSAAADLRDRLLALAGRAEALGAAMDFQPLYKPERHLYAIGIELEPGSA